MTIDTIQTILQVIIAIVIGYAVHVISRPKNYDDDTVDKKV